MNKALTFAGYKIISSPLLTPPPKLSFSPSCGASEEVLEDANNYLLQRFGRKPGEFLVIHDEMTILVPPELYRKIQANEFGWVAK